MSTLKMKYGGGNRRSGGSGMQLVASGYVDDEYPVEIEFEAGSMYMLFCKEYNASTGAYRGFRYFTIATPEEEVFGTTACNKLGQESANAGVTLTWNDDSTLTIERASSTYAATYALYKVF